MNLTPLERLYAERRALQEQIAAWKVSAFQSLSNDGSGWRDEHESEAPDPAMLAICYELITELEARANCS